MTQNTPPVTAVGQVNSQPVLMHKTWWVTQVELADEFIAVSMTNGDVQLFDSNGESCGAFGCVRAIWSLSSWGSLLVAGNDAGNIHIWDFATRRNLRYWIAHRSAIRVVKVVDASTIISASKDSNISVWNISTPQSICERTLHGHKDQVRCMKVQGDLVVSGSMDGTTRLWNWKTGECLRVMVGWLEQPVSQVMFDGLYIVVGDTAGIIYVWHEYGDIKAVLEGGHVSMIIYLHLNEETLVSGCQAGNVIVWSLANSQQISKIEKMNSLNYFDENHIVTGSNHGIQIRESRTLSLQRTFGVNWSDTIFMVTVDKRRTKVVSVVSKTRGVFVETWPFSRS